MLQARTTPLFTDLPFATFELLSTPTRNPFGQAVFLTLSAGVYLPKRSFSNILKAAPQGSREGKYVNV